LKHRLNAEYFVVAAGAENRQVTFNVHDDISGSSLFAQVEGKALDGEARPTPMRRLDSLLPEYLEHPVFLKVDTQGAEIEVLKGLGSRINEIDLGNHDDASAEGYSPIRGYCAVLRRGGICSI
jgi:FkbM family methyltransferase